MLHSCVHGVSFLDLQHTYRVCPVVLLSFIHLCGKAWAGSSAHCVPILPAFAGYSLSSSLRSDVAILEVAFCAQAY